MPRNDRYPSDHQPKSATTKWATALRREMQGMIGQLLRAHYEPLPELPPSMAALLTRIDGLGIKV